MNKPITVFLLSAALGCSNTTGEGEGEATEAAEGEGEAAEGEAAEGEGEAAEGEGEVAEGEGEVAEGEGEVAEGEGEVAEGEGEPILDCNAPLSFDINRRSMAGVRAYHGIAFAPDNTLVSYDLDTDNLEKITRAGASSLFVPSLDTVEQIEVAPNGDVLLVQEDRVLRVTADGNSTRIGGDFQNAYGITIGPDGNAYVSSAGNGVVRINLTTNESQTLLSADGPQVFNAHDVDFSLDSSTMYIATIRSGLWQVSVDENLDPIGEPELIGRFGGWLDAVVVDECGFLWVPDYDASALHRINPTTAEDNISVCDNSDCYTHGVTFGADAAGWNHRAIYLPRPYAGGEAVEVEVGVRVGSYARTFRGVPQDVPPAGPRGLGDETCDNNTDDDGDFVSDCNDTDCDAAANCIEICGNGIDDDGDFARDCQDSSCINTAACGAIEVTIDLGGLDDPTTVAFPFSEVVANPQAGGRECVAMVLDANTDVVAATFSDGCQSNDGDADTELVLYQDGQPISSNDDDGPGLCSLLETALPPGNYQMCVRTFPQQGQGPRPLLPVRFTVSLNP
jgi:hypothetical protein